MRSQNRRSIQFRANPGKKVKRACGLALGALLVAEIGGSNSHDVTGLKNFLRHLHVVYENSVLASPVDYSSLTVIRRNNGVATADVLHVQLNIVVGRTSNRESIFE